MAVEAALHAPARRRIRAGLPTVAVLAGGTLLAGATRLPGDPGIVATRAALAFVALVAESLPFLLAGAIVASFVGARWLPSLAVRHPRTAVVLAPLSGTALPLCDCGLVPIARRLGSGGVAGAAINGFVAGAPLTNPIVILSTLVAFPGAPEMVIGRVGIGVVVAMLAAGLAPPPSCAGDPHDDHGTRPGLLETVGGELVRMGPPLVLAALAAGIVTALLPERVLVSAGSQPLLAAAGMMLLAFLLSLCSQADAFVAASLPVGALPRLAFLLIGPTLNLRLATLYRREFGTRWIAGYAAVVIPAVLVLATLWTTWGPR